MLEDENQNNNVEKSNESEGFIRADTTENGGVGSDEGHENQTESGKAVRRVRELVGPNAVLIPVISGLKKPAIADWQNVTIECMDDPEYLAQLETGSIGVVLGSPSSGLCSIDIDDDAAVEPFLALNPALGQTLRSRGGRGAQFWVQVVGGYQKLMKLKSNDGKEWGEWRADGGQSVIHGIHTSGVPYQIQHEAAPVEVRFDEIKWPDDLNLPWVVTDYDALVEEHGEPFVLSDKGGTVLNQMFFVRKYALEHHVIYDSSLGDFFEYECATGLWNRQSLEAIKRRFLADLTATAKKTGVKNIFLKRTDATASGLVALLRAEVEEHDTFSNRPPAIHVANGMIVFEGDDVLLKSFHPDYRSRNACPFAFDPTAECPRFKNDLLGPALADDDILLLKKWAGAVLMGRNEAQRFLLFVGTPNGGKSTAMSILEGTIGLQNVSQLRTEHLADKFELYGFVGKTLLTGKDVAAGFMMSKGAYVIKALVGHDLLEAEKKGFPQRVQLRGDFNIGITCNADLNIRLEGDIGAWRRRLLIIKYDRPAPTKRIPDFANQLMKEEGSGILRWMVEGAIALHNDLRAVGDYRLSASTESKNRHAAQSVRERAPVC